MSFPREYKPFTASDGPSHSEASDHEESRSRRQATLYDAVAGRVSETQYPDGDKLKARSKVPRIIKHSTKETPLAPDEVLFRRKDAPERYGEHDIYHAHERDLQDAGKGVLPESDLLKAIHAYTSKFYAAKEQPKNGISGVGERSMDETALLAFGILLEEAGRDVLGRRGHLVFTEGAEVAHATTSGLSGDEVARSDDLRIVGHQDVGPWRRAPKRRKVSNAGTG